MLNENAKKLVAALRSGPYEQIAGQLATKDGFCCLGVACEIFHLENPELLHKTRDQDVKRDVGDHISIRYGDQLSTLPIIVQKWLGFSSSTGDYYPTSDSNTYSKTNLAHQNDTGTPFSGIADIIESEPKGLFVD